MEISNFRDQRWAWLSNMHPCPIEWDGLTYRSVEAAYQAAKVPPEERAAFTLLNGYEAKRRIKNRRCPPGWHERKLGLMQALLCIKFRRSSPLAAQLVATQDANLVEGNWWGDTYWGICNGRGENHLGRLLMQIRRDLAQGATT